MSVKMCTAQVPNTGGWGFSRCSNKAKHGDYCGVHCPEKQAERAKARGPTRYERDCDARKERAEYVEGLEADLAEAVALLRPWALTFNWTAYDKVAAYNFLAKHPAQPEAEKGGSNES